MNVAALVSVDLCGSGDGFQLLYLLGSRKGAFRVS